MSVMELTVGSGNVGGAWIKGKDNMKMSEIQSVMDSFQDGSVLKTKDKAENLQDLIAVSNLEIWHFEMINAFKQNVGQLRACF